MTTESDIVKRFSGEGLTLSSHGFERIISGGLDVEEIISKAKENRVWLVTDEFIEEFVREREDETVKEKEKPEEIPSRVTVEKTKKAAAQEIEARLEILDYSDVSGKSTGDGSIDDFIKYFNGKYSDLRDILRDRPSYRGATTIEGVRKNNTGNGTARLICMVTDKRESSKGYKFLEVEDPTGDLTVLIPRENARLQKAYEQVLLDEVIGVEGKLSNNLFIASDLVEPDIPVDHQPTRADEQVSVALTSDLHVGSYLFLEKEFKKFTGWLKAKDDKVAGNIKYLVVAGDLVDGIGIYPKQEKELSIPDIYKQYDFLAELLSEVPDYIEVVLSMGNHDAVRQAEPQPKLPKDLGEKLYELPNVHVVGNPAMVSMHGVKTLVYHGTTMDSIIGNLADCTYKNPEKTMVQYLRRRHLAPMYGSDAISPEERDYMVVREVPDILHSGHVHTNGYGSHRGVRIINSGTWQAKTSYQEQLGHEPTPAQLPAVDLMTHEISVIHFNGSA